MNEVKTGVNSFSLKCLAITTMLIDHIGAVLFPELIILRCIGRIAFPIYCYLIVEGVIHTSDLRKYLLRLFLFALLSEVPFDLAFSGELLQFDHQNVFFTLFLGTLAIAALQRFKQGFLSAVIIFFIVMTAGIWQTDYSFGGVCFILAFYLLYNNKLAKFFTFALLNFLFFGGIQNYALFALVPITLYDGKRGPKVKYIFYIFYPLHLFFLFVIKYYLERN